MNLNELAREEVGKAGSAFHFCTTEAGDTVAAFSTVEAALAYARENDLLVENEGGWVNEPKWAHNEEEDN